MRRNALVLLFVVAALVTATAADGPYRVVKEIKIGGPGGWDYISVDATAHRIYVSHATKAVVADSETGMIVGESSAAKRVMRLASRVNGITRCALPA